MNKIEKELNDIDEKIKFIEKLEDSDSSLDIFIESIDDNLTIINENELKKSIKNYVLDNSYLNMQEVSNTVKKTNKFARTVFDYLKIGFATCVCVMLTILMTHNEDSIHRYMKQNDISISEKLDDGFSVVSSFMNQSINDINKEEEK
ncbi:MAG: hypothetical protein MJ245_00590 [Clostridia bacterium]|nr:hypothetical protein [Clostridia bacterium]